MHYMDDFLKMDLFFAITTFAVILLTGLISVALYRLLRLFETLDRIAKTAETEAELIREDIQALRVKAGREGLKLRHIVKFLGGISK